MAGLFDDLLEQAEPSTKLESRTGLFDDLIEPETEPESDQTVVGSIGRGVGAGLVNIAQGLSELGAIPQVLGLRVPKKQRPRRSNLSKMPLDYDQIVRLVRSQKLLPHMLHPDSAYLAGYLRQTRHVKHYRQEQRHRKLEQ